MLKFIAVLLAAGLMLTSCSEEPDPGPQHLCNADSDCTADLDNPFMNPERARCIVRPGTNFRECTECLSDEECPAGAQCHARFRCRVPDFDYPDGAAPQPTTDAGRTD